MSSRQVVYSALRYVTAVLFVAWAAIHLYLYSDLIKILPIVAYFFVIDAILSLIGAVVFIIGLRILYIPSLIFSWANYLLLTESRVYPAPFLGFPLPAINVYVISTLIIDVLLIIIITIIEIIT
ncbi:hypothetical protein HS7_01440 [Sulfolobales archaeon HS-7]|nr:hypothetical protein HS7_01440 [Sulfolobales archaeon HS-7]